MVEVDVNVIQKYVDKLISYSSELEQIHLNIFNQLKNSCIDWHDGHSEMFSDAVFIDKKEANEILKYLNDRRKVYSLILDRYKALGKKIKCNFNNKNNVLNKINECYYQTCDIIDRFSWIDRSFYFDELYDIDNQCYRMKQVKNGLNDLYNKINKLFKRVEMIEIEIRNAIKKLKSFYVKKFDFDEGKISI